jgi:hypothetical protein
MVVVALFYLTFRCLAYIVWCYVGVLLLNSNMRRRLLFAVGIALGLGIFRFLLGLVVQYMIFTASSEKLLPFMRLSQGLIASYFTIIVPTRIMEWLVILFVLQYGPRMTKIPALAGEAGTERPFVTPVTLAWVSGGVILSCLLDLPMRGAEMYFSR